MIKTYSEYIQVANDILDTEKGQIRVSSFNIYVKTDSQTEKLFDRFPKNTKFIVGTSYSMCSDDCPHCKTANLRRSDRFESYKDRWGIVLTEKHHMKYFSRGKKAIIGGFNLSESSYTDFAVLVEGKEVADMNKNYDEIYSACEFNHAVFTIPEPIVTFGKHKGKTIAWLRENDSDYLSWMIETLEPERLEAMGLFES